MVYKMHVSSVLFQKVWVKLLSLKYYYICDQISLLHIDKMLELNSSQVLLLYLSPKMSHCFSKLLSVLWLLCELHCLVFS
jgi:hypothetical protein